MGGLVSPKGGQAHIRAVTQSVPAYAQTAQDNFAEANGRDYLDVASKPVVQRGPRPSRVPDVPRSDSPRYDSGIDFMSPLNPLSPISPFNPLSPMNPSSSFYDSSSSSDSSGCGSSSYDYGSSSSDYGSSSSYDCGSSGSSGSLGSD